MTPNKHELLIDWLENDQLRIGYLREAGPRLIRLEVKGNPQNLFGELPSDVIQTALGDYHLYGGHRLWYAPENKPGSYLPDDEGLTVQKLADGVKLIQPIEPGTGIQKSIEVHLPEHGLKFEVQHSLTNQGEKNIQLAPWAITIFPLGGATILPLRGLDEQPEGILPDRRVVLWPYTDIEDPRIQLTNNFLVLKGQAVMPPAKVGAYSPLGWVGYLGENTFVLRRFEVNPEDTLADMGCNIESYCSDKIIELETLGAFSELKPGKQVTFSEQWEIFPNMNYPATTDGIRQLRADLKV